MQRREVLSTMVALAAGAAGTSQLSRADVVHKIMPWQPGAANAPQPPPSAALQYLTGEEFDAVAAIADRLIPADALSIGGREAGCATFIDRQLAGNFGRAVALYRLGPFYKGTPEQGTQEELTPAQRYRAGLAALASYCQKQQGKQFASLDAATQDKILTAMDAGTLALGPVDGKMFFELVLQNVREGFLADPLYGGNKDMASWKMLGFPGARYDFRPWMDRKGEKLGIAPTSMIDNTL